MEGLEVRAAIYSTATGRFLLYTKPELTREWERLARLPRLEFTAETAPG